MKVYLKSDIGILIWAKETSVYEQILFVITFIKRKGDVTNSGKLVLHLHITEKSAYLNRIIKYRYKKIVTPKYKFLFCQNKY